VPELSADGITIHYERGGAGPPLLFLNGSGATLAGSGPLLDLFRPGFDLAAADHRGLGLSSPAPGPYGMADCARDAVALLDHLGWDRARVLGISFGGMVAQELAVTHPERVERLVLLSTSPGGPAPSYPLHELDALEPEEQARVATRLLDSRFTPEWLAAHPADRGLVELLAARRTGERSEAEARGAALQMAARAGHDVVDRLVRVSAPTFVGVGRFDGIAPPANAALIADGISGAQLHEYEGGHAFFVQDPRALPDVAGFLAP
jgi:pimeloyl-ACP methyl ester carboxylesterase